MITTAVAPFSYAAEKIENCPMKPLVRGIPAKAIKKSAKADAANGERFPRPFQRFRSVTSPDESRTKVTTANPPTVATPYANR